MCNEWRRVWLRKWNLIFFLFDLIYFFGVSYEMCLLCEATKKRQRFEKHKKGIELYWKATLYRFICAWKKRWWREQILYWIILVRTPEFHFRWIHDTCSKVNRKRKEMWFSLKTRSFFDRLIFPFMKSFDGITNVTTCDKKIWDKVTCHVVVFVDGNKLKRKNSLPSLTFLIPLTWLWFKSQK